MAKSKSKRERKIDYLSNRDALELSFPVGDVRGGLLKTGAGRYRDYSLILKAQRDKLRREQKQKQKGNTDENA